MEENSHEMAPDSPDQRETDWRDYDCRPDPSNWRDSFERRERFQSSEVRDARDLRVISEPGDACRIGDVLTYSQKSGELSLGSAFLAKGYSGAPAGRNNPVMEHMKFKGPVPRGLYTIQAPETRSGKPYALVLIPDNHNAHHRSTPYSRIMFHGARVNDQDQTSSEGCLIFERKIRTQIWNSGVRTLRVVP